VIEPGEVERDIIQVIETGKVVTVLDWHNLHGAAWQHLVRRHGTVNAPSMLRKRLLAGQAQYGELKRFKEGAPQLDWEAEIDQEAADAVIYRLIQRQLAK
jgi:hypothetical protein